MIRFIAADLDGTLLDSEKRLPEGFCDLVGKMSDMGIVFCAASGRQYPSARALFGSCADRMMFIAENGGAAYKNDEMIYSCPLDNDDVLKLIKASRAVGSDVRVLISGEKSAYVDDKPFYDFASRFCAKIRLVSDITRVMDEENERILKIAVYDTMAEKRSYPALEELGMKVNVILSDASWVDVVPYGVTKGKAVGEVLEKLGIGRDEAMAFGDYLNDIEMMEVCSHSFAMANGHPAVIEAAAHTAPSNDDNGVVRSILEFIPELSL